jgi:hypothetical protein
VSALREFIDRAELHGPDGLFGVAEENGLPAEDLGRLVLHLRRVDRPAATVLKAIGGRRLTLAEIAQRTGLTRHRVQVAVEELVGRGSLVQEKDDRRYRRTRRGAWRLAPDERRRLIAGLLEASVPVRRICEMAGTTPGTVARMRNGGSGLAETAPRNGSAMRRERVEFARAAGRPRMSRYGLDPVTALGVIFRREIPKGAAFTEWVVGKVGIGRFVETLLDYRDARGEAFFKSVGHIATVFPGLPITASFDATSGASDHAALRELLGAA